MSISDRHNIMGIKMGNFLTQQKHSNYCMSKILIYSAVLPSAAGKHGSLTKCEFFSNRYFPAHHLVIAHQHRWLHGDRVTWNILEIHYCLSQRQWSQSVGAGKEMWKDNVISQWFNQHSPCESLSLLTLKLGWFMVQGYAIVRHGIFCWGKHTAAQMFCCFSPHAPLSHQW